MSHISMKPVILTNLHANTARALVPDPQPVPRQSIDTALWSPGRVKTT